LSLRVAAPWTSRRRCRGEALDAADDLVDDGAAAVDGGAEVEGDVFGGDAPLLCVADVVDDVGVLRIALEDAAPVEAEAADAVAFKRRT
jgi:hypothetical protein